MAEKKNFSRIGMRFGCIVSTDEAGCEIRNVVMPELDQKYTAITADDIPGNNDIDIFGTRIPLLAKDELHFKGEAIMALFGPDYESAEILKRQIIIETGEIREKHEDVHPDSITINKPIPEEDEDEEIQDEAEIILSEPIEEKPAIDIEIMDMPDLEELRRRTEKTETEEEKLTSGEYGWGNLDDYRYGKKEVHDEDGVELEILKEFKRVQSTFTLDPVETSLYTLYTATCWMEGNILHIEVPTQYPELVRESIARVTGLEKKKIILHIRDYNSPYDEFFYPPAKLASLAAIACLKLKAPVELRTKAYSRRGAIRTERITYMNEENRPVAEEVVHTVDLGAFPYLWKEYQRQAIAGLIPSYPLSAFKATVKIEKSINYPSTLFASLGYSEALAATEYHVSELAKESGMTPFQFKIHVNRDKRKFTDYLPAIELGEIRKLTTAIAQKSSFDRKWSANNFQRGDFGLLGYLKGIGIASGIGIAGFSTSFIKENEFSAKMTYTAKDTVTVNSSAFSHGTALRYWKSILQEELGLEKADDAIFLSSEQNPIDSGPKILSRFVCNFSRQLQAGAKRLRQLKETEKPPFSLLVDVENKYFPCEFDEGCFGAMAIELRIDERDYEVTIEEVWAEYSIGVIADEATLVNTIRQAIMRTLVENGANLSAQCGINITINRRITDNIAAVGSVTRALTTAALMNAITQAFGKKGAYLPTSASFLISAGKR